ncbi:hypothetical protein GOB57_24415 [Sinorhizobium meliloti]|nr:hypothetical protein [Sinorhizobium meliloti]
MFRKLLSLAVCLSTVLTQVAPASAQQFVFRHKYPLPTRIEVPSEPGEIAVGNNIVAYYTAPVGKPFHKRIPVKTTDVADWRVVSGNAASGVDLDQAVGVYEGTPDVPQEEVQTLSGYDAGGNLIAKAEVHFNVVQPQGIEVPIAFFAHTNQYSYNVIPSPEGVEVDRWVPLMTLAPGMDMRNEALEGSPTQAGVYTLFWQGYDYLKRPVAYAWGDFEVTDGPVLARIPDQHIDPSKGQSFRLQPSVTNALGSVSWKLLEVDGYRPPDLTFSSITGEIGGKVAEFGMEKRFQLVVTDAYDGTSAPSNIFTLSTAAATFAMDAIRDQEMTLNVPDGFRLDARTSVKDLVWSFDPSSGPRPAGVDVNPETGSVGGVPREIGEFPGIVVRVDGPGGFFRQTNAFKITVFERDIRLSTTPLIARLNTPFETAGVNINLGRVDPVAHSFVAEYTPPGDLTIAADTGKVKSTAGFAETTSFGVPIGVRNGDGQPQRNVWQSISVYPAIALSYGDVEFTRFDYARQLAPTVNGEALVGNVEYSASPALPTWLRMEGGRIRLDYSNPPPASAAGFSGTFTVSVTDQQGVPVSSNSFTIGLNDRPALKIAAETMIVERYVSHSASNQVYPARASDYFKGVTYRAANLPKGLSLDQRGFLVGSTDVTPGRYPGVTITATDGDGQEEDITIEIEVVADTGLRWPADELAAELTWAAGRPFTLKLPKPYNAKPPLAYTIKSGPAGLSVDADGVLSGTVATAGSYAVEYEIDDDTARAPITGTASLVIEEPFEFDTADWQAYKGEEASFVVPIVRGIKPITYTYLNRQDMPTAKDWRHYSGRVSGTPVTSTGGFPVEIAVEDKAGVKKTFKTTVDFNPPHPLGVTWPDRTLYVGEDTNLPKEPSLSDSTVAVSSWAYSGALPDGVGFDSATGAFFADPLPGADSAGVHAVQVIPAPADPDVTLARSSFPVTLKIGYSGDIVFPGAIFKHRAGKAFKQVLSYSRAVAPVKFTELSLADGVSFDGTEGSFSAAFADPGSYTAGTIKIEENDDPAFNREKTAAFAFDIVPRVSLTVPSEMTFGQHDARSVAITEVLNVIGDGDPAMPDVTYAPAEGYPDLPEGLSVNRLTGAVEGTPEVFGTFGPFAIAAMDAYGDTENSNEFTVTVAERQQLTLSYPTGFDHFRRYGRHESIPTMNGYGPYTWSIDREPPLGIVFDRTTGTFTANTDELVEPQAFRVTVIDSKGGPKGTASVDVTLGITERQQLALAYDRSPLVFTRHITDSGVTPTVSHRVQRGGTLEFSVAPALPACLGFDPSTGKVSMDPACTDVIAPADYTITATDATYRDFGNELGRTVVSLSVQVKDRPEMTLVYPGYDASARTFGFRQHEIGSAAPDYGGHLTADVTWDIQPPLQEATDPLPDGLSFDYRTGTIHANSGDEIAPAEYVVRVADEKDGARSLPVTIGVAPRASLEFETGTLQEIPLNQDYALELSVKNVIGDVVRYELLPGSTLPTGIFFDTDGQGDCGTPGTFCGTSDVADHGKTFIANIRATDDFDGDTGAVPFSFTVVEDATPMSVTYGPVGKARVGHAYSLAAPKVEFAVGNHSFAAPALASLGLDIDPKTGAISGVPNTTFEQDFAVTVTDRLGPARAVTVTVHIVSVPTPTVTVPNPLSALFNREIVPANQPQTAGVEGTAVWMLEPTELPPGLSFDATSGVFTGVPMDIGTYGEYTLTLKDDLPGSYPTVFSFDIGMNDDPIDLEELSVLTKVGFPFATKAPTYDNNYGAAVFSSPELATLGLAVDTATGVVSGTIHSETDAKPNLTIRDSTTRTTSMPVNLRVLPRMRLTAPETVTLTALDPITTPVAVTRTYVAGTAVWNLVDPALLPQGVSFDTATGTFVGTPTKVQTMVLAAVSATDTFGGTQTDTAQSNPITFVVKKGAFYMEFKPGDLPVATKRSPYSFDLVSGSLFEYEGMDRSEIVWALADASGALTPEQFAAKTGLSVVNGVLTGTPADEGVFDLLITAKFADRAPVTGTYRLTMELPDTQFGLSSAPAIPDATKGEAYSFDFRSYLSPLQNVPFDKVTWSYVLKSVAEGGGVTIVGAIEGITFDAITGLASGSKMEASGNFVVEATATFHDRSELLTATQSYTFAVAGKDYRFTKMATGTTFTCGITPEAVVQCWGANNYRQTGSVRSDPAFEPLAVANITDKVVDLDAGHDQACAVTATGRVYCWGWGSHGTTGYSAKLPTLQGPSGARSISVGNGTICAVTTASDVWCWGASSQYQAGSGRATEGLINLTSLNGTVQSVSVGDEISCAVTTSGEGKCWGRIDLDFNNNYERTQTPTTRFAANVVEIAAGKRNACAVLSTGSVSCVGVGISAGLTGNRAATGLRLSQGQSNQDFCYKNAGMELTCKSASTRTYQNVLSYDMGPQHTCITDTENRAYCTGTGYSGKLGNGSTTHSTNGVMVRVTGL